MLHGFLIFTNFTKGYCLLFFSPSRTEYSDEMANGSAMMEMAQTLGQRLKQLRECDNLSMEALAALLKDQTGKGSPSAIHFWEKDDPKRSLNDNWLRAYAAIFENKTNFEELARLRSNLDSPLEVNNALKFTTENKVSMRDLQRYLFKNDNDLNSNIDVRDEIHGTSDQWADLTEQCPELMVLLLLRDRGEGYSALERIIGYWQLLPLQQSHFDELANGRYLDAQLSSLMIDPLFTAAEYWDVYAAAIMLDSTRSVNYWSIARKRLFESYIEVLLKLRKEIGFFIRRIVAVPETKEGQSVAHMIGMNPTGVFQIQTGCEVFSGDYSLSDSKGKIFQNSPDLKKIYATHFEKS